MLIKEMRLFREVCGRTVAVLFKNKCRVLLCHGRARWYGREREGVGGNRKESDNPYYAEA